MDIRARVHNPEQVTGSLMTWQDRLNDKVSILSFDWNLNLKYCFQVVYFNIRKNLIGDRLGNGTSIPAFHVWWNKRRVNLDNYGILPRNSVNSRRWLQKVKPCPRMTNTIYYLCCKKGL